jgi:SLOG-like protein
MAGAQVKPIFLSASMPVPNRDPRYDQTADAAAIAEAVRALALFTLSRTQLVFGGHPAISPLVRTAAEAIGAVEHVVIYQSRHFQKRIPKDSMAFSNFKWTYGLPDPAESLLRMRRQMIDQPFSAGVFIGGMEGVEEEFELFRDRHPTTPVFPVASTGAAALFLFQRERRLDGTDWPAGLLDDICYDVLFERLLGERH